MIICKIIAVVFGWLVIYGVLVKITQKIIYNTTSFCNDMSLFCGVFWFITLPTMLVIFCVNQVYEFGEFIIDYLTKFEIRKKS